jgi:hypothetical protein
MKNEKRNNSGDKVTERESRDSTAQLNRQVFRDFGLLKSDEEAEEVEERLQRLCGVVDVNTFELRSPGVSSTSGTSPRLLRGLFPESSFMSHACRANAHVSVDEGFRMSAYAAVAVKAGEVISFNYTSCLLVSSTRSICFHLPLIPNPSTQALLRPLSSFNSIRSWCHYKYRAGQIAISFFYYPRHALLALHSSLYISAYYYFADCIPW